MQQRHADRRRLEAFEMWIWRRMEKISWLDNVTNEEVLRRVNEDRQILNIDGLAMFWHTMDFCMKLLNAEWKVNQQKVEEEFKCYTIWQMVALLHWNGQLRTETQRERMSKTCCTAEDYWGWGSVIVMTICIWVPLFWDMGVKFVIIYYPLMWSCLSLCNIHCLRETENSFAYNIPASSCDYHLHSFLVRGNASVAEWLQYLLGPWKDRGWNPGWAIYLQ